VCRLTRVPRNRNLTPRFANGDLTRPLTPFFVVCNGSVVGIIWLDRSGGRRPATAQLTEQLIHDVPLPVGDVRMSPAARGLTGLETWFWVDGYDGHPVIESVRALGTVVEVEATPIAFHWDFGDGTAITDADLGRAAPARSTVIHVYDTTSTGAGFRVALQFEFAVRYRVDGGPWTSLPPVTRTATRAYPVVEVRGQLASDSG
jgi:hypothetical protein